MNQDKATIKSRSNLQDWLNEHEIDFSQWGQSATKTLENLLNELNQGEAQLQSNPPLRVCNVVQVIVRQKDKLLIESGQKFHDTQLRQRNLPPSEKMKRDEPFQEAAVRCLVEELRVQPQAVIIVKANDQPYSRIVESPSYPGLRSRYIVYTVEATVAGLPTTDFCTEEIPTNSADPISKHYWTWQLANTVNLTGMANPTKNGNAY